VSSGCFCGLLRKRSAFPVYEDLNEAGSPGSHKKIIECDRCSGDIEEIIQRHSFKRELQWHCICGAKDPAK
jgi:hypothetical protein